MSEIGIILTSTVIATLISSIVARKNLKTSTYINVITSERIKWLDIIRNEVTNIITQINLVINNIEEEYDALAPTDSENDPCQYLIPKIRVLSPDKIIWKEQDFIGHLYILKLRLNPKEDLEIISIIDYYIIFFSKLEYSSHDIGKSRELITKWVGLTQELLKKEWEKVKKETLKK